MSFFSKRVIARLPSRKPRGLRLRSGRFELLGPFDVPGLSVPRLVRVYVPFAAGRAGRRGSLVMFDGQNIFDDEPSFAGGWYLHDAVEKLARRQPAPVVIGIDHGGKYRLDELCPWAWGQSRGQTDLLLDWLVKQVMPELGAEYGLDRDPRGCVVGGSSMGGLAALYAHVRHPDAFGGALCMSPAFWFANRRIFPEVASRPRPRLSRIYLDCGTKEAAGRMVPIAEQMVHLLLGLGYDPSTIRWRVDKRGEHNERAWRRRLPAALRFLYDRRFIG